MHKINKQFDTVKKRNETHLKTHNGNTNKAHQLKHTENTYKNNTEFVKKRKRIQNNGEFLPAET